MGGFDAVKGALERTAAFTLITLSRLEAEARQRPCGAVCAQVTGDLRASNADAAGPVMAQLAMTARRVENACAIIDARGGGVLTH